jgi:hypothetical protein
MGFSKRAGFGQKQAENGWHDYPNNKIVPIKNQRNSPFPNRLSAYIQPRLCIFHKSLDLIKRHTTGLGRATRQFLSRGPNPILPRAVPPARRIIPRQLLPPPFQLAPQLPNLLILDLNGLYIALIGLGHDLHRLDNLLLGVIHLIQLCILL